MVVISSSLIVLTEMWGRRQRAPCRALKHKDVELCLDVFSVCLSCSVKSHVTSSDASLVSSGVVSLNDVSAVTFHSRENATGFWQLLWNKSVLTNWFSQEQVRLEPSEQAVVPTLPPCAYSRVSYREVFLVLTFLTAYYYTKVVNYAANK